MTARAILLAGAVACAFFSANPASAAEQRFFDGPREVLAARLGPARLDARGRVLSPILLRYADGRTAAAEVDHTSIVRVEPGQEEQIEAYGARLVRLIAPSLGLWLVESDDGDGLDLAERLAGAPGVIDAIPNLYLAVRAKADPYTPTDPRFGGQWYFHNLDMPLAWGMTRGSPSASVVVVDTGCDLAHPDLAAKLDAGLDVIDGDTDPSFDPAYDGAAHGTECAGIIGAATDNGEGIAGGCPECRLRCVRFLGSENVPLSASVDAFQFALDVDAAVVSNSWGYVDPMPVPSALADVIVEVSTNGRGGKGALVIFAAGNDDRVIQNDEIEAAEGVFCVGAINNFDESTPFTNQGEAIDVVAPTGTVTTDISGSLGSDPTDYTNLFGGTSSACPVVAGIAGLLVTAAPDKTATELYDIMVQTAKPAPFAVPDANGHDLTYGYGIVQPVLALETALGISSGDGGGGAGAGAGGGTGGGAGSDGGDDDDGCGCALPGSAGGDRTAAYLAVAFAFACVRRRRRATK
jgi:subtilisin family serine protease